jgi:hypothetical protein
VRSSSNEARCSAVQPAAAAAAADASLDVALLLLAPPPLRGAVAVPPIEAVSESDAVEGRIIAQLDECSRSFFNRRSELRGAKRTREVLGTKRGDDVCEAARRGARASHSAPGLPDAHRKNVE